MRLSKRKGKVIGRIAEWKFREEKKTTPKLALENRGCVLNDNKSKRISCRILNFHSIICIKKTYRYHTKGQKRYKGRVWGLFLDEFEFQLGKYRIYLNKQSKL